jgi:hypothetical protein
VHGTELAAILLRYVGLLLASEDNASALSEYHSRVTNTCANAYVPTAATIIDQSAC